MQQRTIKKMNNSGPIFFGFDNILKLTGVETDNCQNIAINGICKVYMCKVRMMMMMMMMMHFFKQFIVHHLLFIIMYHPSFIMFPPSSIFLYSSSINFYSPPSFTTHIPSDALGEAPGASTTCVLSVCHQGEEVLDKAPTPLRDVQGPPSNEDAEVMTLSWVHQFPFCVAFRCFGANGGFRKFRDFWFYIRNK